MNPKWIKYLNIIVKVIKLFKENIGLNLYNLELGNDSLNIKSKAQETKEKDKFKFIKI